MQRAQVSSLASPEEKLQVQCSGMKGVWSSDEVGARVRTEDRMGWCDGGTQEMLDLARERW